eukprot:scaffold85024_cov60-Phaeocystis_antarctica.AAC.1
MHAEDAPPEASARDVGRMKGKDSVPSIRPSSKAPVAYLHRPTPLSFTSSSCPSSFSQARGLRRLWRPSPLRISLVADAGCAPARCTRPHSGL